MAIQSLTTIKGWFRTALKPSQQEFWDTWDSYWHKHDKLPLSAVDNLENILNDKVGSIQLETETQERKDADETKADKNHGHIILDVEDLQTKLDNKADVDHEHVIDDVDGLQTALDNKANMDHVHTEKPPLSTTLTPEMQLNGYRLLYADCSESIGISIQDLPIGVSVVIMINVLSTSVVSFTDAGTTIPTIGKIDAVGKYTVTILKFNKTNIRCNIAKYE